MKLNVMGIFSQNEGVEYILPISGALEKYTIILIWEIMLFFSTDVVVMLQEKQIPWIRLLIHPGTSLDT
jgi:hypothetical protein